MDKFTVYRQLVERRKACRACDRLDMTNPSVCDGGQYDTEHIGPWTQWQGRLDAELMVIGQDWGSVKYYRDNRGTDDSANKTNANLKMLLASVGYGLGDRLYFTNAVLCLKEGSMNERVKAGCFRNCGIGFLKPQIELVQPRVVVTLGRLAYRAVMHAYDRRPQASMRDAVKTHEVIGSSTLFPMYHCGPLGTRSRSLVQQKGDWERVRGVTAIST